MDSQSADERFYRRIPGQKHFLGLCPAGQTGRDCLRSLPSGQWSWRNGYISGTRWGSKASNSLPKRWQFYYFIKPTKFEKINISDVPIFTNSLVTTQRVIIKSFGYPLSLNIKFKNFAPTETSPFSSLSRARFFQ